MFTGSSVSMRSKGSIHRSFVVLRQPSMVKGKSLASRGASATGLPMSSSSKAAMAHKVLVSLESPYGDYCVDIFMRADGTFGFEECRRDPEDGGGWYSLHRYSSQVFDAEKDA